MRRGFLLISHSEESVVLKPAVKREEVTVTVKKAPVVMAQKVSAVCAKCKRTSDICEEVKKELSKAQKDVKTSSAKVTNLKKSLDEKEGEVKILKEQLSVKLTSVADTKHLRKDNEAKGKRIIELEEQFRKNDAKHSKHKTDIENLNVKLQKELEKTQLDNKILERKLDEMELNEITKFTQLDELMFQKTDLMSRNETLLNAVDTLRQNNKQWQNIINDKDDMISKLRDQLRKLEMAAFVPANGGGSFMTSPDISLSSSKSEIEAKRDVEVEKILDEMKIMLEFFTKQDDWKNGEEILRKYISKNKSKKLETEARSRFVAFQRKYAEFLNVLHENIHKIEENVATKISDLLPIPTVPEPFTSDFMRGFEESIKDNSTPWKTKETNKALEIEDEECLICHCDIEKKQKATKCDECGRKYHHECASTWLKKNAICPVCRSDLKDPKEYPTLQ